MMARSSKFSRVPRWVGQSIQNQRTKSIFISSSFSTWSLMLLSPRGIMTLPLRQGATQDYTYVDKIPHSMNEHIIKQIWRLFKMTTILFLMALSCTKSLYLVWFYLQASGSIASSPLLFDPAYPASGKLFWPKVCEPEAKFWTHACCHNGTPNVFAWLDKHKLQNWNLAREFFTRVCFCLWQSLVAVA